ncbi:hypothetical protein F5878DRAFT_610089 [Lentinula raphanica]|uniref:Uncharacterized protein n=1 Tax=Lentinula raphanica TaxID=153919 RepID=A0AA38PEL7_9AGAR|nr:hypothetical protein F5878DRAFT_610089 [Lentinula raphanica]
MTPTLDFFRRDRFSFPRSVQPPFTIVPSSTMPGFSTFPSSSIFSSSTGSDTSITSSSSTQSDFSTSTTSFTETVISIPSSTPPASITPSLTSSSSSSSLPSFSLATLTSTGQSFLVSSTSTQTISTITRSLPSSSSGSSASVTRTSLQTTQSVSSPSASTVVPATTTSIAIADGTSTSVVFLPTTASSEETAVVSSGSTSGGFWSNKAAVAGTFTAVAVVALATLAGVVLCIRKKRRESHSRDRSSAEKFASMDFDNARPYSTPSEPASHDFSHEQPMDAYANRDPAYYTAHDPFVATAHNQPYAGSASLPEITYNYAQDVNNQYPYYGNDSIEANNAVHPSAGTRSTPALLEQNQQNPFDENQYTTPPRNVVAMQKIPRTSPNPFNDPVFRRSPSSPTYQPSLDSFYGAPVDDRPF